MTTGTGRPVRDGRRRPRAHWLHRLARLLTWPEPWRRVEVALGVLAAVLVFGTAGYVLVGLSVFDAFYQTAITISTVGYGEIGPDGEVDRAYRAFTLLLVFAGAGSAVYTVSVLLEALVDRAMDNGFRRRRVQRRIDRLEAHVIVAGWGRVGRSIAAYARRHDEAVVAIDADPGVAEDGCLLVVGDATDEDTLEAAGIARAASLIAALGHDGDNLSLTLAARSMRPDILIVARVADARSARKFERAGADRVVNPYEIGGARMAALAFRPHVAEFLDDVVHADEHDVDIHEYAVGGGAAAAGTTLAALAGDGEAATVLAVKGTAGAYTLNPSRSYVLAAGDVLIAVGSRAQLDRLRAAVSA